MRTGELDPGRVRHRGHERREITRMRRPHQIRTVAGKDFRVTREDTENEMGIGHRRRVNRGGRPLLPCNVLEAEPYWL